MVHIFAVLLFIVAPIQQPNKPPVGSGSRQSRENAAITAQPVRNSPQPTPEDRLARYTFWLMVFTGALVGTSAISIFFLVRADRTARIAANAAEDAARGTSDSVRTMKDTAQHELRAYVSVVPKTVSSPRLHPIIVELLATNDGKTPAREVRASAALDIFDHPLPKPFTVDPIPFQDATTVIHPRGHFQFGARLDRVLSAPEIAAVLAGTERRLYCYGIVRYVDVFEGVRETRFCFSIVKLGREKENITAYFEVAPVHNEGT